jgi:threonine dehydratase
VEPAGAAGVAALLTGAAGIDKGANVVCVATGGNVDAATFARLLGPA